LETIRDEALVFLPHLRRAERGIASAIKSLAAGPSPYPSIDFEKAAAWCEKKTGKILGACPRIPQGRGNRANGTGT